MAALAAGYKVVATGRDTDKVAQGIRRQGTCGQVCRIDVLVNNAAHFCTGSFEELLPEQMERQLSTGLIGPMNVTRAILPVKREQRSVPPTLRRSSALRDGCSRCRWRCSGKKMGGQVGDS